MKRFAHVKAMNDDDPGPGFDNSVMGKVAPQKIRRTRKNCDFFLFVLYVSSPQEVIHIFRPFWRTPNQDSDDLPDLGVFTSNSPLYRSILTGVCKKFRIDSVCRKYFFILELQILLKALTVIKHDFKRFIFSRIGQQVYTRIALSKLKYHHRETQMRPQLIPQGLKARINHCVQAGCH
jgi:hypothetical protein